MITRIGFVLVEKTGEYNEIVSSHIAYSDNQFELEQEITRLNQVTFEKQTSYDFLLEEAETFVSVLNLKLDFAFVDYDNELVFEEEIPDYKIDAHWSDFNLAAHHRNRNLRNQTKLSIVNKFREKNEIPNHLKEMLRFSEFSYPPQFVLQTRPTNQSFEIHSLST